MKIHFLLLILFTTFSSLVSCNIEDDPDGCDLENDCLSLSIDGEDFFAESTTAMVLSLLGNSTMTVQGNTDVSTSDVLAISMNIVNPSTGNHTITNQNVSQKSIKYYDANGNEFTLVDGNLSILQFDTEEILVEGNFSGTASSTDNGEITLAEGYFIVNQPE